MAMGYVQVPICYWLEARLTMVMATDVLTVANDGNATSDNNALLVMVSAPPMYANDDMFTDCNCGND